MYINNNIEIEHISWNFRDSVRQYGPVVSSRFAVGNGSYVYGCFHYCAVYNIMVSRGRKKKEETHDWQ